ncbi:MAG: hypothetical protein ACYSW8_32540 [Planctomycetota bacterium]
MDGKMKTPDLIILILTLTICSMILAVIGTAIINPEQVKPTTGGHILELSKYILGMIAGYLGGRNINNKQSEG